MKKNGKKLAIIRMEAMKKAVATAANYLAAKVIAAAQRENRAGRNEYALAVDETHLEEIGRHASKWEQMPAGFSMQALEVCKRNLKQKGFRVSSPVTPEGLKIIARW